MSAAINYPERYQFMCLALESNTPDRSIDHTQQRIDELYALKPEDLRTEDDAWSTVADLLIYLNKGSVRSAEPLVGGKWEVNLWVKQGILLGFRLGGVVPISDPNETLIFSDRPAFPLRPFRPEENVRIVPGGSSVRAGSFLGDGVTVMPPSYVNTGTYIDRGTLIDSKVLVGTCAQVGANCHISMDASIGGVIEPPQAMPCIVEDNVTMFGGAKIAEGVMLRKRVVLGMGVHLASSTELHDLMQGGQIFPEDGRLTVPEDAVVIPGTAPFKHGIPGRMRGIQKQVAIIVKYRDSKTDAKTALEEALR